MWYYTSAYCTPEIASHCLQKEVEQTVKNGRSHKGPANQYYWGWARHLRFLKLCRWWWYASSLRSRGPERPGSLAWHTGPPWPCPCSTLQPHFSLQSPPYLMLLSYQDASHPRPPNSPCTVTIPCSAPHFSILRSGMLFFSSLLLGGKLIINLSSGITSQQKWGLSLFGVPTVHLMSICKTSAFICFNVCLPMVDLEHLCILSTQRIMFMANKGLLKKNESTLQLIQGHVGL